MDGVTSHWDGVQKESRRPSSCHCNFNFMAVCSAPLPTNATQQVRQMDESSAKQQPGTFTATPVSNTKASSVMCFPKSDDDEVVNVHETTAQTGVVLDLSMTSYRQSQPDCRRQQSVCPPVGKSTSSADHWEIYRRYMDDLKRLDELIQRRTYERNVLSWRRDRTKRSLERLLRPVCTCRSICHHYSISNRLIADDS